MMKKYMFYLLKRYRSFAAIGLAFLIWMIFFDDRNVFVQKRLSNQIIQLENEYIEYEAKLEKARSDFKAMQMHPEKYAREKYFMHKPSEEVFIYKTN